MLKRSVGCSARYRYRAVADLRDLVQRLVEAGAPRGSGLVHFTKAHWIEAARQASRTFDRWKVRMRRLGIQVGVGATLPEGVEERKGFWYTVQEDLRPEIDRARERAVAEKQGSKRRQGQRGLKIGDAAACVGVSKQRIRQWLGEGLAYWGEGARIRIHRGDLRLWILEYNNGCSWGGPPNRWQFKTGWRLRDEDIEGWGVPARLLMCWREQGCPNKKGLYNQQQFREWLAKRGLSGWYKPLGEGHDFRLGRDYWIPDVAEALGLTEREVCRLVWESDIPHTDVRALRRWEPETVARLRIPDEVLYLFSLDEVRAWALARS